MRSQYGKDYITDKGNCQELADKIKAFYKNDSVEVWVETIPVYDTNTGARLTTRYEIASNLHFRVPQFA